MSFPGKTQVEVVDSKGQVKIVHMLKMYFLLIESYQNCPIISPSTGNQNLGLIKKTSPI